MKNKILISSIGLVVIIAAFILLKSNFFQADETTPVADYVAGCANSDTAKCMDFGALGSQDASGASLLREDGSSASFDELFEGPGTDGAIRYYSMKSGFSISLPAIGNRDSRGFPTDNLMLEIRYQDVYTDNAKSYGNNNRVFVSSKVNYQQTGAAEPTVYSEVGKLLGTGEKVNDKPKWRYEQIPFPVDDFQQIRVNENKFTFKFTDSRIIKTPVPIDYISLKVASGSDVTAYNDSQAKKMHVVRANYTESKPFPSLISNLGSEPLIWYSNSAMKNFYPNYHPDESEIHRQVNIFSTLGEIEPFNIGLLAGSSGVPNVSFKVNDLVLAGGTDKISAANIRIQKVIYNDRLWARKSGFLEEDGTYSSSGTYGIMPDYVQDFISMTVRAYTSQMFWGEIKIGENTKGGEYSGEIQILIGNSVMDVIPVKIKVAPVKLSEPSYISALYSDPSMNLATYDDFGSIDNVKMDMKDHDILSPISNLDITIDSKCGAVDYSKFKNNFLSLKNDGLLGNTAVYNTEPVFTRVNAACMKDYSTSKWSRFQDPSTLRKLEEIFKEIKRFADENKIEIILSSADEPKDDPNKNAIIIAVFTVAKKTGLRTWSTYNATAFYEKECPVCSPCEGFCYVKDGKNYLPSLNDYVDIKTWSLEGVRKADSDFKAQYGYYTTYFSQIKNPVINRFLNSYFAYYGERTRAVMIANWTYAGKAGSNPYLEFDSRSRDKGNLIGTDYFLSYPSWDGKPNASMSIKGLREGIKDAKYITTLEELIQANRGDSVAAEAKRFLEMVINETHIKPYWEKNYSNKPGVHGLHNRIITYLSDMGSSTDYGVFDRYRKQMSDYIERLNKPHVTIKANKTEVSVGEEVTYYVDFKNSTVVNATNSKVSVPIPQGTSYVVNSASDGGEYRDNKVTWTIDRLPANQTIRLIFKVRAK